MRVHLSFLNHADHEYEELLISLLMSKKDPNNAKKNYVYFKKKISYFVGS
jgi:hypothetical protein